MIHFSRFGVCSYHLLVEDHKNGLPFEISTSRDLSRLFYEEKKEEIEYMSECYCVIIMLSVI